MFPYPRKPAGNFSLVFFRADRAIQQVSIPDIEKFSAVLFPLLRYQQKENLKQRKLYLRCGRVSGAEKTEVLYRLFCFELCREMNPPEYLIAGWRFDPLRVWRKNQFCRQKK